MKSLISKAKSEDAKTKSTLKLVKQDLGTTSRLYDTEVLSNRTMILLLVLVVLFTFLL